MMYKPQGRWGLAVLVLGFLGLSGCAIGWTDAKPDGSRDAIAGWKFGTIENAFNGGVRAIGDVLTSWTGIGGLGAVGAVGAALTRSLIGAKVAAARAEARHAGENDGWDAAVLEHPAVSTVASRAVRSAGSDDHHTTLEK